MTKTNAQLRRKSNGKSYAIVDVPSRFIFGWHRKGDPLPRVVCYEGKGYLLDQAAVDQAQVNQRAYLQEVSTSEVARVVSPTINGKGALEFNLKKQWYTAKALALWVGGTAAAGLASWAVTDHFMGRL